MLGTGADRAFVLIAVLSLVWLAWAVFRLGARCSGRGRAWRRAFFAASSFSLLLLAARGYRDVPFLALVFWAAVRLVEGAQRPVGHGAARRRGAAAARGVDPRRAARAVAAARRRCSRRRASRRCCGPGRPRVTGDPLRSLTGTSELAEELGRERGIANVPGAFVTFVADALRPPVALMAVAGLASRGGSSAGGGSSSRSRCSAPGIATFVGTGVAGLSILPRYLTVPTVALCLFAGYAVAGFTTLPRTDPLRRLWTWGASSCSPAASRSRSCGSRSSTG